MCSRAARRPARKRLAPPARPRDLVVLVPVLALSKQRAPALRPVPARAQQVLSAQAQPPLPAEAQGRRPEPPQGPPKQHAPASHSLPAQARRAFVAQPSAPRPAELAVAPSQPRGQAPSCRRGRGPAQPRQAQPHRPDLEAGLDPNLAPDSAAAHKPRRASAGRKVRRCRRRHGRCPPPDTERRPADRPCKRRVAEHIQRPWPPCPSPGGENGRPAYAPIRPSFIKRYVRINAGYG